MEDCLPLSTLLSCALVAFTIEFDNEFEHRMPHRTTNHGSRGGPWLGSMVLWMNCMQFVREEGITVREVERLAGTKTNWDGMRRWGYIAIEPAPTGTGAKHIKPDAVIRPTAGGRKAREVWGPLFNIIEERWRGRFGESEIGHLREALCAITSRLDANLPDCLPILHYGLFSKRPENEPKPAGSNPADVSGLSLPTLLSRVLLAFALEFEHDSEVSLAISANVLRLAGEQEVRVRDLPRLSGVSKEAIAMALSFLEKRGYAMTKAESPGSRVKVLTLTPRGRHAQDTYRQVIGTIEERWQERFGKDAIERLRHSLQSLVGDASRQHSPLFGGLEPYSDGWRASARKSEVLPHYPMVLHRGGFPDGS